MGQVKDTNIKHKIQYFFSDMINLKDFDSSLLKTQKTVEKHWYLLSWIHHNKKRRSL